MTDGFNTTGPAIGTTSFDFHNQTLSYKAADGLTDLFISMDTINSYNYYHTKLAILYASQLGACLIMAIVLCALTSSKKYLQPIFVLNLFSLILGFLRALFLAIFVVSPWIEFFNQYSGDFTDVPFSAYRTSVAATIFPLLMSITVSASLVLQAHSICKIMDKKFAFPLVGASIIVVLLTIGFRFAQMVTNAQAIMGAIIYPNQYLRTGTLVSSTLSIWWFMVLFTYKLVYTIYTRHRNGWKPWGYQKVLVIMSGCTMIIPSVFAILQYTEADNFPEAGTLTLTTTALLLPLSSMWARMANEEEQSSIREAIRVSNQSSDRNSNSNTRFGSQSSTVMGSEERKGSTAPFNATTIDTVIEHATATVRDSTELDLERMGVRVDHSYSVNGARS